MTRSARAREGRVPRRLPRWLRVRSEHPADALCGTSESGTVPFDSDRFRGRVNSSLGVVGGQPEGKPETISRWS